MADSYCGKNCRFCVSRTSGKCSGCKPETIALLHDPTNEASEDTYSGTDANIPRFSSYCQIAICCKNKNIDGCIDCQNSYTCEKYSKKGIMNTIIDSHMEAWGMVDHGLKKAVPFLYILLVCFITSAISDLLAVNPSLPGIFYALSVVISGVQCYAYYRLRSFNGSFLTVSALTLAYIFTRLFIPFLDYMRYGVIGTLLEFITLLVQIAASILCYKISFDAFSELVSPVDSALETHWSRIWPLTIVLCAIALIVGFFCFASKKVQLFVFCLMVAFAVINIITFILMIRTIRVCKKD